MSRTSKKKAGPTVVSKETLMQRQFDALVTAFGLLAEGDLNVTYQVEGIEGLDEDTAENFLIVEQAFNEAVERLKEVVNVARQGAVSQTDAVSNLGRTTAELKQISEGMVQQADRSELVANDVQQHVQRIAENMSDINSQTHHVADASLKIAKDLERARQAGDQISTNMVKVARETTGVTTAINGVADDTRTLSTSLTTVSAQSAEASTVAEESVKMARQTAGNMDEMGQSARNATRIIGLITEVSAQTKLLALNATIEAARAGESGRGFAVVAQEVKNLAAQTNDAAASVRTQIEGMQQETQNAIQAITLVVSKLEQLNQFSKEVAVQMDRQTDVTTTISDHLAETAISANAISRRVNEAADFSGAVSQLVAHAVEQMSDVAKRIKKLDERAEGAAQMAHRAVDGTVTMAEHAAESSQFAGKTEKDARAIDEALLRVSDMADKTLKTIAQLKG